MHTETYRTRLCFVQGISLSYKTVSNSLSRKLRYKIDNVIKKPWKATLEILPNQT